MVRKTETQVTVHMSSKYAVDTGKLDGETVTFLSKSFGCARKVYNLYVDTYYQGLEQAGYQNGDDIPKVALPEVSSFKNQAGLSYLKEVDSLALANVKQQFEASVKRFREQDNHKAYTKRALRRSESGTEPLSFRGLKGMPKFHAKGHCRDSYTTNNQDGTVRLEGSLLKVPKLRQLLPLIMHRPLPEGATIKNATISREGSGEIFVSIGFCYTITMDLSIRAAVMDRDASFVENLQFLGLDYSQKDLYVDSEGNRAGYPHYYRKSEEKLARLQQKLSRMVKGSHNYEKQLDRIRKLHKKIANQRKDFLHKLSTYLVSRYDVIVVEDMLGIEAKVPRCTRRSTCTLSDLVDLYAAIAA